MLVHLKECFRLFRKICTLGKEIQIKTLALIKNDLNNLMPFLLNELPINVALSDAFKQQWPEAMKLCWQLLANMTVNNVRCQIVIWNKFKETLLVSIQKADNDNIDICLMIVYNIYLSSEIYDMDESLMKMLLQSLRREIDTKKVCASDFLHIFLEHFITRHDKIVPIYLSLTTEDRLLLIYFIADYLRGTNPPLSLTLLQHIMSDFKKKSDCVLKTDSKYVEEKLHQPKEVLALLEIIAIASAHPDYLEVFETDTSLFINLAFLLQSVHSLGKESTNIFTPLTTLSEVAPNSSTNMTNIEQDISYDFKSMLIRSIGNLSYRNNKFQQYVSPSSINMKLCDVDLH